MIVRQEPSQPWRRQMRNRSIRKSGRTASELKLYGRAEEAQAEIRELGGDAWWASRPPEQAHVFSLELEQAVLVSWDLERGEMTVRKWWPELGLGETTRTYP